MAEPHYSDSDGSTPLSENELPDHIREAYVALREAFPRGNVRPLRLGEDIIRIALDVEVNLPSRGSASGIRKVEPITLTFERTASPLSPPRVRSDRPDFPRNLPHLNPTSTGLGAWFCLHRTSLTDWFAEHSVVELVERARGWLADAAAGYLIRKDDDFEGTLVPADLAYAIYDAKAFDEAIRKRGVSAGHLVTSFRWLTNDPNDERLKKGRPALEHVATMSLRAARADMEKAATTGRLVVGGILAWAALDRPNETYFSTLPSKLGELVDWATTLGISLKSALDAHVAEGIPRDVAIPITLAIPRGRRVIGTDLTNEYLTFLLVTSGGDSPPASGWNMDAEIFRMSNRKPMTATLARDLSSLPRDASTLKTLLLGAGALGSKLSLHLARRGEVDQTIVDVDTLEPHNVIRHGLLADSVARPKAEALADAVRGVIPAATPSARHATQNILDFLAQTPRADLATHARVIDATASSSVFEALLQPTFGLVPVTHCALADAGRLGMTLIEGNARNPRLDDLQAALHDRAIEDDAVSRWLQLEQQKGDARREQIQLGMACSSDTMRLADDVVSHHAASMSMFLRAPMPLKARGALQLSWVDPTGADPGATRAQRYEVGPTSVRSAGNWTVRFVNGTAEHLLRSLEKHKPRETGGGLIGFAHFKRRTTYVTRVLDAPPDSRGAPHEFVRGTQGLEPEIKRIEQRTGGLLGYIGEWHTHPKGGARPSSTDLATTAKFVRERQHSHAPTMLVIVTPGQVTPYVYE